MFLLQFRVSKLTHFRAVNFFDKFPKAWSFNIKAIRHKKTTNVWLLCEFLEVKNGMYLFFLGRLRMWPRFKIEGPILSGSASCILQQEYSTPQKIAEVWWV